MLVRTGRLIRAFALAIAPFIALSLAHANGRTAVVIEGALPDDSTDQLLNALNVSPDTPALEPAADIAATLQRFSAACTEDTDDAHLRCLILGTYLGQTEQGKHLLAPELERECDAACEGYTLLRRNLVLTLDAIGYGAELISNGQSLTIRVNAHAVVRKIYIHGNWPISEQIVRRHVHLHPGQRLPGGDAEQQMFDRQADRLQRFLRDEGYFEGRVVITTDRDNPLQVNVHIHIDRGHTYYVGRVEAFPGGGEAQREEPASNDSAWQPALPPEEIRETFLHYLIPYLDWFPRRFNTRQLQEDTEELRRRYQNSGYPGVRIKERYTLPQPTDVDKRVHITLEIRERKKISTRFRGDSELDEDDFNEVLTFAQSGAYDDYEAEQSARKIEHLYQSKGFLAARVRVSRHVGREHDTIAFQIKEGPRYRVERIEFVGNERISTDALQEQIMTKTYPWLGLGSGGYVTPVQLGQDVDRLRAYYRSQAFLNVAIFAEIVPDPALFQRPAALAAVLGLTPNETRPLYVRFVIREGIRYRLDDVQIWGTAPDDTASLRKSLRLQPQSPYNPDQLGTDNRALKRRLAEQGYPFAEVESRVDLDTTGQRQIVHTVHRAGSRVNFGPIFIRGNFKTKDSVIRSALDFSPGDPFDPRRLETSEDNLRQLGIFTSVNIQLLNTEQANAKALPILIAVEERYDDWGAFEISAGGSTDNPFFGTVGYDIGNFLGYGVGLEVRGEAGPEIQRGNLGIRLPRILGHSISAEIQTFVRNEITVRLGNVTTYGGTFTLGKTLAPNFQGLFRYIIQRFNRREDLYRSAGSVDESRQADVPSRTGGIGPTLIYDNRDNPLLPTEGVRVSTSLLWAGPYFGASDTFLKINTNAQGFVPLPLDITIAIGVRYDHGVPLAGATILPKAERFFAGGDTTIRGFLEDRAFAQRVFSPLVPYTEAQRLDLIPLGSNIRLLTNVEIQAPIWRESILFGLPIYAAVFTDNGVAFNSFDNLNWGMWRHSVGLAGRLFTPVGFVSFEYAWPLDPEPGDPDDGRFHFNFGFIL